MNCQKCQQEIAPERLEALPNTTVCISCAQQRDANRPKPQGYMIATASKGTALALQIVDPEDEETYRLARRAHMRSR